MYNDEDYEESSLMKELFEDEDGYEDEYEHEHGYEDDSMEDWADILTEDRRLSELKNENRDVRGRLKKGSRIAVKMNCDKDIIRNHYRMGLSVKDIVEKLGCSKTTVYNAIKNMDKIDRLDMDTELPFK